MASLPHSPAAQRNQEPILAVLRQILPVRGVALEVASGTGQHAVAFADALKDWVWQPTEADEAMLPVIASRIAQAGLANVRPPLLLDVTAPRWPAERAAFAQRFDAIYCANMLHISPWATCAALMQGAKSLLARRGMLITYGPYFEQGVAAAPSNVAFDESLRMRNPAWGIRRVEDVESEAWSAGLVMTQRHAMPANNLLLVFKVPRPRSA